MAATSQTHPAGASPPDRDQQQARTGSALGPFKRFLTLREGSIIVITLVAIIYFGSSTPHFFTLTSFKNLLPFFAPYAIMAAGEVFVMINGEIDLSIGGTYLFSPFVFYEFHQAGIPLVLALILALVVMVLIGVINGIAVSVIGLNSFVATLGMLFALEGLTLIVSHSTPITPAGTTILGNSSFEQIFGGGTYSEVFWALGIVIVLQVALSFTRWGIYTVAVGGNRLGATEAGINHRRNMIRNFAVCALLAGLVGILETTRSTTATPDPSSANLFLFQAISAAVIGGTLLLGGSGTVVGALIGALFLGVLYDGLNFKGVNANYVDLYLGIAILIAMVINVYIARVRTGSGHG